MERFRSVSDGGHAAANQRCTEGSRSPVVSLAGEWFDCKVEHVGGPLLITDANKGIVGGMSGSPILDAGGSAIGVATLSSGWVTSCTPKAAPIRVLLAIYRPGFCLVNSQECRLAEYFPEERGSDALADRSPHVGGPASADDSSTATTKRARQVQRRLREHR